MIGNKLIFIYYISLNVFHLVNSEISDKRLCANADCTKPISGAVTQILYNSADKDLLSFKPKEAVLVYSKSAGTRPDLWGVKINGVSGYVPHKFLKELKVYDSKPTFTVSTNNEPEEPNEEDVSIEEELSDTETDLSLNKNADDQVQPDKVKQAHEVFDGTTIYSHEDYMNDDEHADDSKEDQDELQLENLDEVHNDTDSTAANLYSDVKEETAKPEVQMDDLPPAASTTEHPKFNENFEPTSAEDSMELADGASTTPSYMEQTTIPVDPDNVVTVTAELPQINLGAQDILKNVDGESETTTTTSADGEQTTTPVDSINTVTAGNESSQNNLADPDTTAKNATEENEDIDSLNLAPTDENHENKIHPNVPEAAESPEISVNNSVPDINKPEVPLEEVNEEIADNKDEVKVEHAVNTESNLITKPVLSSENLPPKPMILPTIPLLSVSSAGPSIELASELDNLSVSDVNTHNAVEDNISQVVSETKPDTANLNEYKILEDQINQILEVPEHDIDKKNIENEENVKSENVLDQKIEISYNEPLPPIPVLETAPDILVTPPSTSETSPNLLETPPTYNEQNLVADQQAIEPNKETIDNSPITEQILELIPQLEPLKSQPYQEEIATSESSHMPIENIIQEPGVQIDDTSAEEAGEGFLTGIFGIFSSNKVENANTKENIDAKIEETQGEPEILASEDSTQSFMDAILSSIQTMVSSGPESKELFNAPGEACMPSDFCETSQRQSNSSRLLLLLGISATTVLVFTLGYYYIDNKRQDGRLVAMVNSLQRDLLCSTKECDILKDELTATKEKLTGIEDSSFGTDEMVLSLKEELEELRRRNDKLSDSLDENEKLLRVSENTASELQNTLGDLLNERAVEEDQMVELNDKLATLEDNMSEIVKERDELKQKLAAATKLVDSLKGLPDAITELKEKLKQSNETVESQRYEIVSLKESFKQLQSGEVDTMQIASLLDQTELKAKLTQLQDENKALALRCETESQSRASLEEELSSIRETLQSTEERAMESTTRLEVLGKYFKERESELLKELSSKESLWLSKQGESISTVEKIEALQQEVQQYKDQADSARRELAECEARARAAASAGEARAHTAWLEARAAAREAAAHRDEAAALRRKLAQAVAQRSGASPLQQIVGERLASPLEQLDGVPLVPLPPPLPPLAFLPPPPGLLPPLPRPPPLGRLPSPSPPPLGYTPTTVMADSPDSRYTERRYSPESRAYSPDSRIYSPNRRSQYSPEPRRNRYYNKDRYYNEHSPTRGRNHFVTETETDFSPPGSPHPRSRNRRYSRRSGSSGSGRSSESLEKL